MATPYAVRSSPRDRGFPQAIVVIDPEVIGAQVRAPPAAQAVSGTAIAK
jgi:hypothetical protein